MAMRALAGADGRRPDLPFEASVTVSGSGHVLGAIAIFHSRAQPSGGGAVAADNVRALHLRPRDLPSLWPLRSSYPASIPREGGRGPHGLEAPGSGQTWTQRPNLGADLASRSSLVRMLLANQSRLSSGNRVDLITDGNKKFRLLFKDLEEARDHIHAEYYVLRDDELGNRFLDLLVRKAGEGLEVRLLVDGVGTRLPPEKVAGLRERGVKVLLFFPPVIERLPSLNLRINHRNHRKIVVIDGRVGYLGGFNVGDEYLGRKEKGRWRDTHVRVEGPVVLDLQARFLLDWDFTAERPLEIEPRHFPPAGRPGDGAMQIVLRAGPPGEQGQGGVPKMIGTARRERVHPVAVLCPMRGDISGGRPVRVDVRVMMPAPDHPQSTGRGSIIRRPAAVGGGLLFEDGFARQDHRGGRRGRFHQQRELGHPELCPELRDQCHHLPPEGGGETGGGVPPDHRRREWTLQDHLSRCCG